MNDFDIIKLNDKKQNMLIIMKTSEAPFDYIEEIQESLKNLGFIGDVIIDELLHSGNTEERFIVGHFDGDSFESAMFSFAFVEGRNEIRSYICEYLQRDKDSLQYSGLTERQQKLIMQGCYI